jgi:hypothetical protein
MALKVRASTLLRMDPIVHVNSGLLFSIGWTWVWMFLSAVFCGSKCHCCEACPEGGYETHCQGNWCYSGKKFQPASFYNCVVFSPLRMLLGAECTCMLCFLHWGWPMCNLVKCHLSALSAWEKFPILYLFQAAFAVMIPVLGLPFW